MTLSAPLCLTTEATKKTTRAEEGLQVRKSMSLLHRSPMRADHYYNKSDKSVARKYNSNIIKSTANKSSSTSLRLLLNRLSTFSVSSSPGCRSTTTTATMTTTLRRRRTTPTKRSPKQSILVRAISNEKQLSPTLDIWGAKTSTTKRWQSTSLNSISRSISILIVIVCFLIIANSKCDQVGSANVLEASEAATTMASTTTSQSQSTTNDNQKAATAATKPPHKHKYDPLDMLREIYLDHSSKVITLLPEEADSVQKFRPNGRYGRRSIDLAEPMLTHTELGKLVYNDDTTTLGSTLRSFDRELGAIGLQRREIHGPSQRQVRSKASSGNSNNINNGNGSLLSKLKSAATASQKAMVSREPAPPNQMETVPESPLTGDYGVELNRLLKCNFTGIANLYWCDTEI